MENNYLIKKLRDKLDEFSYSYPELGPHHVIVFLDMKYREALLSDIVYHNPTSEPIVETYFESYIGLNGDKSMLKFVSHKGIDNIDIFVKWK
jgi:hypothetical protein